MKIIFIPGLGYDHRIFENLDLPFSNVEYINWIEPKPNEKLEDYSKRIFSPFINVEDEIILLGHSFGGILAQEIARIKTIKKIILISSIKSRKELPLMFKAINKFRLHKIFTKELCIRTVKFWGRSHGFAKDSDKALFKSMVGKNSNYYLQWALKGLSSWEKSELPSTTNLIQIHGPKDKTFPIGLIENPNFVIEDGDHLLVYQKANEMSKLTTKIINDEQL